jgi:hypothetical protein
MKAPRFIPIVIEGALYSHRELIAATFATVLLPVLPDDNEEKFAGLMGNDSVWYFTGAKLFPNVKGCGYPPMLNCSIFYRQYANIGQNFSCYYSKVDPGIVISDLDMWQVSVALAIALVFPSRVRGSVFKPRAAREFLSSFASRWRPSS